MFILIRAIDNLSLIDLLTCIPIAIVLAYLVFIAGASCLFLVHDNLIFLEKGLFLVYNHLEYSPVFSLLIIIGVVLIIELIGMLSNMFSKLFVNIIGILLFILIAIQFDPIKNLFNKFFSKEAKQAVQQS